LQIHFSDLATVANLFVLLGIYGKMRIITYQHKLMWADFAARKHISPNGAEASSKAAGLL
jgi:hypothetical protein